MKELPLIYLWYAIPIALLCYLIGCFNFAVLISHIKKSDIREIGSGNPGSMNMTRSFGLKFGAINFFCDLSKGGLPVLISYLVFKNYVFEGTEILVSDFSRYLCGVCVIIGHIYPVTMKFKGGKGIASTMGLFVFALPCEEWWYFFIVAAFLLGVLLFIAVTEFGSTGSLIGVTLLPAWQAVIFILRYKENLKNPLVISMLMLLLIIVFLTWFAHRKNIFRLLAGEEHRTAVRKHKKKEF